MSDTLIPRRDTIFPEELLAAAGLADSHYEKALEAYESAELDPGQRLQAELQRAKIVRWLVNECYYGQPCDLETGSPTWDDPVEAAKSGFGGNILDTEHSSALRYFVALAGNYAPLEDDESWFQNLFS